MPSRFITSIEARFGTSVRARTRVKPSRPRASAITARDASLASPRPQQGRVSE
jgi:hypothetical protein